MNSPSVPNFVERKGSLFLRSDHMDYSRPTLVSNWHQARESEPKDYDIKDYDPEKRRLHFSTYNRVGNSKDSFPISTSHDQMAEAINLKDDFQPRETRSLMITQDTFGHANSERPQQQSMSTPSKYTNCNQQSVEGCATFHRDTGCYKQGYCNVLPRHPPHHNKRYFDTTQKTDYQPPYPYVPKSPEDYNPNEFTESPVWKKCHSQFTDIDDYHRLGNNTWHDQSGYYANCELRASAVPQTDPILSRLN